MAKKWKKIIAILTSAFVLSGMIAGGHAPITAHADGEVEITIEGDFNDTTKQATYTIGEANVVVQFASAALDGRVIKLAGGANNTVLNGLKDAVTSVSGYDPDTMEFVIESREEGKQPYEWFHCNLTYTDGVFARADGGDGGILAADCEYHLSVTEKQGGQPGGEPGPEQGNYVAHIEITSSDGTKDIRPCVYEDFYPHEADDTVHWDYSAMKSWQFCSIAVNYGQFEGFVDGDRRYSENPNDSVDCFYNPNEDESKIDVTFSFNWSYRPEEIIRINDIEYEVKKYVDFDNEISWLDAFAFEYRNQDIQVTIPNVPANIDDEGVANLSIVLDLRPIEEQECYIGNFLWSSNPNPNNPDDDQYIGHSDLALISATYPTREGLDGTTFKEETLVADSRLNKEEKTAKYITYGVTDGDGEMVLPIGTKVTMRVAPEFGYQVTAFKINGQPIEQGEYVPGTDVAVYTFTIESANFHLGADVVKVDNEVKSANTDTVSGGSVALGQGDDSMKVGTAKLEVEDATTSDKDISGFANEAGDGVISDYIDISLYNTVYKGTSADSWDTEIHQLQKEATITLALEEGSSYEAPYIIHQKSDDDYEILETTYDPETNTISFKTDSFSKYAIADKNYPTKNLDLQWDEKGGKGYWYEGGVRQGTLTDPKGVIGDGTVRGREIYDPGTNAWYWLDACYDGAAAVGKEVWMPYIYQDEKNWDEDTIRSNANDADEGLRDFIYDCMKAGTGKWVRYNENGQMLKGWVTIKEGSDLAKVYGDQVGNTYYYDNKTGAMAKGDITIDGVLYHFDEITGVLKKE